MANDGGKGGDDAIASIFLFIIVISAVLFALWFAFHPQISKGLSWLRYGQMELATAWIDEDNYRLDVAPTQKMAEMVYRHDRKLRDPREFEAWRNYLPQARGDSFKFMDHAPLSELALRPYKYIVIGIFALFCLHTFFLGPTSQFRRKFSLDTLIEEQAKNFPHIRPFIKFNPRDIESRAPGDPVPAELPIFAEALAPEEWIAYNRITFDDRKLDLEMTRRAFEKQLGDRWRGPKALKPHEQVLLAGFILKAARKRQEADDLLGRLAACWSHEKGLELGRDRSLRSDSVKILRDKKLAEGTINAMKQHAYVVPALIRALDYARSEGGVLAPAQFVWMRAHDRNLWYALNNLGKQAYHIEAIGALSHFKQEKRTMRPIPVPKVDDAVDALAELMNSSKARPVPELDYGPNKEGSKTRGIMKPLGSG